MVLERVNRPPAWCWLPIGEEGALPVIEHLAYEEPSPVEELPAPQGFPPLKKDPDV